MLEQIFNLILLLISLAIWIWVWHAGDQKIENKIEDSRSKPTYPVPVFYNKYAHIIWMAFMFFIYWFIMSKVFYV